MKPTRFYPVIVGACLFLILIACVIGAYNRTERFVDAAFDPTTNPENVGIADALAVIIDRYNVTTITDLGCGDCVWLPILLEKFPIITYVGYEKSPELVNKAKLTLAKYKNASVQQMDPTTVTTCTSDLVISRNLFSTLPYSLIRSTIRNCSKFDSKQFAFGVFTTSKNLDIRPGENFKIDLEGDPFNMSPAYIAPEGVNGARKFFVYDMAQIKGYTISNGFWK